MSTAFYTYPSSNHSRFEHSLGVMKLASKAFETVINSEFTDEEIKSYDQSLKDYTHKCIRVAALLHDIGHSPFSHIGEPFYDKASLLQDLRKKNYSNIPDNVSRHSAELMTALVIDEFYSEILEKLGLVKKDVIAIILSLSSGEQLKGKLLRLVSSIIDSQIDVDKLDYVMRDSLVSGARFAPESVQKMLSSFCAAEDGSIAINTKSFSAVISLINSREALFRWVYQHHTVCFSDSIIDRLIRLISEDKQKQIFSTDGIKNLSDDYTVISYIRELSKTDSRVNTLYSYLRNRVFLKPLWKDIQEFEQIFPASLSQNVMRLAYHPTVGGLVFEEFLESKLNLENKLIVCSRAFTPFNPKDEEIMVISKPGAKSEGITEYFGYLKHERIPSRSFYIYSQPENHDKLKNFLKTVSEEDLFSFSEKRN